MEEGHEAQAAQRLSICQVCEAGALVPRLLPCLHAICGTCLQKLLRHGCKNNNGCPTCQVALAAGVSTVSDVPANNLAQMLFKRNEKQLRRFAHACAACVLGGKRKDKSAATMWCKVCTEYFCEKCNRIHQEVKSDEQTHDVIRISQMRKDASWRNASTLFRKPKEMCAMHPKESLKFYCDQCEKPICKLCEKDSHEHVYLPINNVANDKRTEIKNSLLLIEEKFSVVFEALKAWDSYEVAVELSQKETSQTIDSYANELILLVQSWQAQCLNTLQRAIEKEREDIYAKRKDYRQFQTSLETAATYGKHLLLHGQDGFVTYVQKNVVDRLQELNSVTIEKPGKTFSFSFQQTPSFETAKVFGNLIVDRNMDSVKEPSLTSDCEDKSTDTLMSEEAIQTFSTAVATDRLEPWITGLSCTVDGDMVVADHRNNVLKLFNRHGSFKQNVFIDEILVGRKRFSGPSQSLWDCTWLPDGTIVTASVDGLHIFNTNSEVIHILDEVNEHTSVTVTPAGEIISYNGTKGHVSVHHAKTHRHLRSFPVYENHSVGWISKIAIDRHENILLCDVNCDIIKVYSPSGSAILEIGAHGKGDGEFIHLRGVCSDGSGSLIAVDKGNHRIQKLSLNGAMLKCLMTKADGLESPSSVTLCGQTKVVVGTEKGLIHILPNTLD